VFLTSALEGGEWSALRPGRFIPGERTSVTHWREDWMGPRARLDAVAKIDIPSLRRKSNPDNSVRTGSFYVKRKPSGAWNWILTSI